MRPTVTKQKCYNVIDVARVLGPAMILRDPATPTVPQGALPRSAAERVNRFQGVAEDSTSASYAHGGDDAEYKKEFRM